MAAADPPRTRPPSRVQQTSDAVEPRWQCLHFAQVPARTLYGVLALRSRVFVVEQQCFYEDMDGADLDALLVIATITPGDEVVATARVLPPGSRYAEPSIGRVCTDPGRRGRGWGRRLMTFAIDCARRHHPGLAIRISAQARLQAFYESLGFAVVSPPYLEDGIPHLEMRLAAG